MTTLTEKELIALIRSSELEDKAKLATFLDTAPTMVVNNLLYEIAAAKAPSPMTWKGWLTLLVIVLTPFFAVSETLQQLHRGSAWWDTLCNPGTTNLLLVTLACINGWERVKRYRGAEEALFLLSARNDSRALPLLMRHWKPEPAESVSAWNDRVEAEATRLLDENKSGTTSDEWKTLRKVVTRITQIGHKRAEPERQDVTLGQAYFAVAILRILARAGGAENGELLKTISELPTDAARFPNRALITQAAHIYYGAPDAPAPVTMQTTVATTAASPLQTLHRS